MKIGLMTTQQFAVNSFNYIRNKYEKFEVISIDTNDAIKYKVSGYYNYKSLCIRNKIPLHFISDYSLKNINDIKKIESLKLDILIVLGWNRIIPEKILESIRIGTIGSHSSPGILPFGRGRSPVVWSIKLGFRQLYNQLYKMTVGIDEGDLLAVNRINIDTSDSVDFIYKKIAYSQVDLIDEAINNLINGEVKNIMSDNINLLLPKRSKENAIINWAMSAEDIHNLIRSVSPTYHGAYFKYKDKICEAFSSKLWDMRVSKEFNIGEIISIIDTTLIIKCGEGTIAIIDHTLTINDDILCGKIILE